MSIRKRTSRATCLVQPLESRTLLSGWSTVDDYQLVAGKSAAPGAVVADTAGNVYAVGAATNSAGINLGIVREKPAGSNAWTTVATYNYSDGKGAHFSSAALDAAGDLFVGGYSFSGGASHWLVLEMPAGQQALSVIDDVAPVGLSTQYATSLVTCKGVAVDAAGDVFAVGGNQTVTNRSGSSQQSWMVRERVAGQTAFSTVDKLTVSGSIDSAQSVAVINSGPNAGVYVAGQTSSRYWVVRKSSNGTAWSTADLFQYHPNSTDPSNAFAIAADATGNLYVTGYGNKSVTVGTTTATVTHWIVRQSTNAGATWTTSDDFVSGSQAEGWGAGTDAFGNVYVTGRDNGGGTTDSVVRTNAGGTWHTIDDFSDGTASTAFGIAADTQGNLYTISNAVISGGGIHWITRELPALSATLATPTLGSTGTYLTTISFNRAISGFDLSDLTLTTAGGAFGGSDLIADGATLTTSDNINYVLSLPSELTAAGGSYQLLLAAAGSGIVDGNGLALLTDALVSWSQ